METHFNLELTWRDASIVLCLAVVLLAVYRRYFSAISDIPGPWIASVSGLWQIYSVYTGKFNLKIIDLHEKYGHFVRLSPDEVSISHPDAVRQLLLSPLNKGPWYRALAIPDYRYQSRSTTLDVKEHGRLAKALAQGYSGTNLLRREAEMDALITKLQGWLDLSAHNRRETDLDDLFGFATYDLAGELLLSKTFGFLDKGVDVGGSIKNISKINRYLAVAGYFYWLHGLVANPVVTALNIMPLGHVYTRANNTILERQGKADARGDILSYWLKAQEKSAGALKNRDVHANAIFALGAGSDTVTSGLQAAFYYMIRHPETYRKAQAEIDGLVARGRCRTPVVSYADTQDLPYLNACIKEGMRVFAPFTVSLQRTVGSKGLTIAGRTFKPGTTVSTHIWAIHHSKEIWGEDAAEFKPERWFADDIKSKETSYIPFGSGHSSCPGQNMARIEMAKIAATIVRDYDMEQVEPGKEWTWNAEVTVLPHEWPVYVTKRPRGMSL